MQNRCPETDTVEVNGEGLELQCTEWVREPDESHDGDHRVQLPPAMGGEHTWPNLNPAPPSAPSLRPYAQD